MADKEKIIRGLKALERSMQTNQCYVCSHEFVDAVNEFGDTILKEAVKLLEQTDIVRCRDCKHRPVKQNDYENGFDLVFPDSKCQCQCDDDGYYSWYPPDNWFCANGERRET